jgi:hypothetical protein
MQPATAQRNRQKPEQAGLMRRTGRPARTGRAPFPVAAETRRHSCSFAAELCGGRIILPLGPRMERFAWASGSRIWCSQAPVTQFIECISGPYGKLVTPIR